MVTNSTTPLTSISAIRQGQKTSARKVDESGIIMSSNNNTNNPPLCPYPRLAIIDCSNNTSGEISGGIDSAKSLNCAENAQTNAQSNPQNAQSNPQNAQSNPQNAQSNPQNAQSNPQNAQSNSQNAQSNSQNAQSNAQSDFERIAKCVNRLEASGWYYGRLNWEEATNLLKSTPVGTFLVRDSSYPACLFALSVQTECGPTSIRIHYVNGQFKLDAEETIACRMPLFDCAVQLIDYYVRLRLTDRRNAHVFLDETGKRDRPIFLDKPLYHTVTSLQHLCRLSVNRHMSSTINRIYLPKTVNEYLTEYPYVK